MKNINILIVKVVAAFLLAVCAGLNFVFNAPKIIVLVYWLLVDAYWTFSFITDYMKLYTTQKESDLK